MSTLEKARAAKDKLSKQLMSSFNGAASPVNSVGLSRDQNGYYVAVGLERHPTPAENARLPQKYDGVRDCKIQRPRVDHGVLNP